MTSRTYRQICCTVVSLAIVGVGVIALAQAQPQGKPSPEETNRAKEVSALIEKGQLSLRDAVELAEKHSKGTALEVRCNVESGPSGKLEQSGGAPPNPGARAEKRVIFEVSCFSKNHLMTVEVDADARKVIEPK